MLIQWLQQKLSCLFEADKKNNAAATFKVEVHHNTCPATFAILLFSDVSPSWVLRIGLSRTWNKPKIDIFNILNKAFLLFFRQIIWYIWWHFKVFIFEKSSNIHTYFQNPKSGFQVPTLSATNFCFGEVFLKDDTKRNDGPRSRL